MYKYSYRNKIYSIVSCTEKDIPSHTERVLSYWKSTDTDIKKQYQLLESCIKVNTAFKVLDETNNCCGCLYWKPLTKTDYTVYFAWYKNFIIVGIDLDYIYKYTSCQFIYYMPHQRHTLSYKALLTEQNTRIFYNSNEPIKLDITNYKFNNIYKRYFLDKKIKEI